MTSSNSPVKQHIKTPFPTILHQQLITKQEMQNDTGDLCSSPTTYFLPTMVKLTSLLNFRDE